MTNVEQLAARIIGRASRERAADGLLREELKSARLPRPQSRAVAELVFTYFRWRGFLETGAPIEKQLREADALAGRFASEPDTFSTDDLRRAVPEWIAGELDVTREWLMALQTPPVLWLRAKRGTARDVIREVGNCEYGAGELADTLEYHGDRDLFREPAFQAGAFEVQDISSQLVGLHCAPKPGETWWDACAGEGGKTLHLSDLMGNRGLIWASDRSEQRLKRLKQRAARAQAFNYRAVPWDGSEKLPTKTKFDGVLIDAPCSGVGTWQRNPHARWTTTLQDARELAAVQQRLVLHAARAVKPGGRLIYAVCTLARAETDGVADLCSPQLSGFAPRPRSDAPSGPPGASGRRWFWPQSVRGNGMFLMEWERIS